jgi:N-acetylmuramoyl-L-alanine amidase
VIVEPADASLPQADAAPPELDPATVPIVDRPIRFGDERKRLTIDYRRQHQDPSADSVEIVPKMIVIHHTGGNSADSTWGYFNRVRAESGRKRLAKAGAVGVSAHFVVARDGTVYRLVPENWMARHVIGLNHVAIGVENVGDLERYPLTAAQLDANVRLVRYLASRHPIEYLIGHHEYRAFESHPLFLERDPRYRNRKSDPGPAFMSKLRQRLVDLDLRGPPPQ